MQFEVGKKYKLACGGYTTICDASDDGWAGGPVFVESGAGSWQMMVRYQAFLPNGDALQAPGYRVVSEWIDPVVPVESPDDWVVQDRVAYRHGVDERRWVVVETGLVHGSERNDWGPAGPCTPGVYHGRFLDASRKVRVELRCRRKDLPPVPDIVQDGRCVSCDEQAVPGTAGCGECNQFALESVGAPVEKWPRCFVCSRWGGRDSFVRYDRHDVCVWVDGCGREWPCSYDLDEFTPEYMKEVGWREVTEAEALAIVNKPIGAEPSGQVRTFASGATRNLDTNKYDYEGFLCPFVMKSFGAYMHSHRKQADGTIRDSDNWQKQIPLDVYMKSLLRHVRDVWETHRGGSPESPEDGHAIGLEEALNACLFNVQGYLHEVLKKERQDV
jgi:hypothetical protein